MRFGLILAFITSAVCTMAQSPLRIVTTLPPEIAVKKILLAKNSSVEIKDVDYFGHPHSLGVFVSESQYYLMKKGLILTTGVAEDAIGPNNSKSSGRPVLQKGSAELDAISTGKTHDAASLTITFVPNYDSLKFNFIFASEEYPEYVNRHVNDIFAFFIQDVSSGRIRNLAVLSPENEPVNVDNINAGKNAHLYIENAEWDPDNILQWKDDPGRGELALSYQFDGFTKIMTAGCKVMPGKTYKITFAIADVGDDLYDSAVFLEEGSFEAVGKNETGELAELREQLRSTLPTEDVELVDNAGSVTLRLLINYEFDSDELEGESTLQSLREVIRLMRMHTTVDAVIQGHTDNAGTADYNQALSERRAEKVVTYLSSLGVAEERLQSKGYGDQHPIADNLTEEGRRRNRRVEFKFSLPVESD